MTENDSTSTSTSTSKNVQKLTRISARRAGVVIGTKVYVYRLRRPSTKTGEQKVRDLVRTMQFKTPEQAEVALMLEIEKANERRHAVNDNDDMSVED